MTEHIVVGFDGTPESRSALTWAGEEAEARGCSLEIVSCYRLPIASDAYTWTPPDTTAALVETASGAATAARDEMVANHRSLEVSTRVCAGSAAHELVAEPAQLIVVGASSHSGRSAFWLGSTPRAVVRRAACPVVVVRGAGGADRPQRIVVGIDDSEQALAALNWAGTEADIHHVTLRVVHAWEYPYQTPDAASCQARDLTRIDAARVLDRAVELAREMCGGDVIGELVEGSPGSAILASVRDGDLLVLGSRGRGAWKTGLFGSTVNRVLDEADLPVAVIRSVEHG